MSAFGTKQTLGHILNEQIIIISFLCFCSTYVYAKDCVIFLHGLARTSSSMEKNKLPNLGRVVMPAPPNQGSEVISKSSAAQSIPIHKDIGNNTSTSFNHLISRIQKLLKILMSGPNPSWRKHLISQLNDIYWILAFARMLSTFFCG